MYIHFKIAGVLLIILGVVHIIFPRYFNWKNDLKPLSPINRQMMLVHAFFVALTVFLMGLLCFFAAEDLIHTQLGKIVSLGLGVFWAVRLFVQFFGYSATLWKGKKLETIIHILASGLWMYLTTIFLVNYFI